MTGAELIAEERKRQIEFYITEAQRHFPGIAKSQLIAMVCLHFSDVNVAEAKAEIDRIQRGKK